MYFNFGIIIPQNNEQIIAYFVAAKKIFNLCLINFFECGIISLYGNTDKKMRGLFI